MKSLDEFSQLFNLHQKNNVQIATKWAIVTAVDWEKKTCDVKDLTDDLEYYDVLLGLGSIYKKPVLDTKCLIGIVQNSAQAFLIECEESELIQLNDGELGGLVKAEELKIQIDKNTLALKTLQDVFKAFVPVPSDGGAALKVALNTAYTALQLADLSNVQNEKITHG